MVVFVLSSGVKAPSASAPYQPAPVKGPVSHRFRVIVEGWGIFSARASSDF